MKKYVFFFGISLSVNSFPILSAQNLIEEPHKNSFKRPLFDRDLPNKFFSFSVSPTEIPFGYWCGYLDYKFSENNSIGIGGGHIVPNAFIDEHVSADAPFWVAYNGTVIKLNTKYYFENPGTYVCFTGIYKNVYYSWHLFEHCYEDRCMDFHESEQSQVFGLNVTWGVETTFLKIFYLDSFFGIGIDSRYSHYTIHDHLGLWYGPEQIQATGFGTIRSAVIGSHSQNNIYPAFQAGIKIGFIHEKK